MALNLDSLQATFQKNKKILIPAAIAGGVLGLYVLSKNGGLAGSGGGSGVPGDTGTSGGQGGTDWGQAIAELANQLQSSNADTAKALSDLAASQSGQEGQFSGALSNLVQQVNDALSAQQRSVNDAISSIPQPSASDGGMNGLESLFGQLAAFQAPQALPAIPADVLQKVAAAPPLKVPAVLKSGNVIEGIKRAVSTPTFRVPATLSPKTRQAQLGSAFANTLNSLGGIVSNHGGVPLNIGSGYIPYVQGKVKIPSPKRPSVPVIHKLNLSGGGGQFR